MEPSTAKPKQDKMVTMGAKLNVEGEDPKMAAAGANRFVPPYATPQMAKMAANVQETVATALDKQKEMAKEAKASIEAASKRAEIRAQLAAPEVSAPVGQHQGRT